MGFFVPIGVDGVLGLVVEAQGFSKWVYVQGFGV